MYLRHVVGVEPSAIAAQRIAKQYKHYIALQAM